MLYFPLKTIIFINSIFPRCIISWCTFSLCEITVFQTWPNSHWLSYVRQFPWHVWFIKRQLLSHAFIFCKFASLHWINDFNLKKNSFDFYVYVVVYSSACLYARMRYFLRASFKIYIFNLAEKKNSILIFWNQIPKINN